MTESPKPTRKAQVVSFTIVMLLFIWIGSCMFGKSEPKKVTEQDLKIDAYVAATHFVKQKLLSPSSADFPYGADQTTAYQDSIFIVSGTVNCKNAFGVELEKYYSCTLQYDSGDPGHFDSWRLQHIIVK